MSEEKMREAFEECVMSLLDTVEPVAWANLHGGFISAKYKETLATGLEKQTYTIPLYSRETDESMLSKCRKEALLEAEAAHDHEDVLAPVGNSAYGEAYQDGWIAGAAAYRDELRRMAEGEKE